MSFPPARLFWLLAAVLALVVGLEARPTPKRDRIPLPPAATTPQAAASAAEPVAAWVATIEARPLFAIDRRPPAVAPVANAAASAAGLPRLAGIVVSPSSRAAIFAGTEDHSTVVPEGGAVGAWRVVAIHADAVDLAGPEGARTVKPAYSNDPPPATPLQPTFARLGGPAAALAAFQASQQPNPPGSIPMIPTPYANPPSPPNRP